MNKTEKTYPFLKNSTIEKESLKLLNAYEIKAGKKMTPPIPVFEIIEYLGYDIDFKKEGIYKDKNILGGLNIAEKTVSINENLNHQEGRMNFTAAHETGHIILHVPMYVKNSEENKPNILCRKNEGFQGEKKDPQEWQADKFAAFLLMPSEGVKKSFFSIRNKPLNLKRNIILRYLFKKSPRTSSINFSRKVIEAGNFTNVSKLAMVNRLIGMGLIRGLRYQKNKVSKRS